MHIAVVCMSHTQHGYVVLVCCRARGGNGSAISVSGGGVSSGV